MALIVKDRVRETTITIGTGALTLLGAVPGFNSFSEIGTGNTTYYTIVDVATGSWEVGIGTYTTLSGELSRDTVLESSAGGAKVSFSAGSKEVFITYPADRSVSQADIGTAPNEIPLNQYLGSMAYQDLESVTIDGGVATLGTATISSIQNNTNISETEPTLDLNFAKVKALDPRITFARASEARYYDGKTYAKAEENLLTYSQEFDNAAWSKNGITVTANSTAAPDGTTTADTITPNTTNTFHRAGQSLTVPASNVTISVYAKSNGYDFLHLRLAFGASGVGLAFNLTNGVTSTGYREGNVPLPAPASFSVVDDGDGWYRCSITDTVTAGSATQYNYIGETATVVSFAGDGTSGVYLWGAQLEQRSAVTAYTPTTTQPITLYQPALQTAASGVARFDHDPVTQESLGLLIEEQRTNLVLRSEEFDNGYWTKTNVTVTANQVIAPDGTLTADKIIGSSASNAKYLIRYIAGTLGTGSYSIYAKAGEQRYVYLKTQPTGTTANYGIVVDLATGIITQTLNSTSGTTVSNSVQSVGNGWYRISFSINTVTYTYFSVVGVPTATISTSSYGDASYTGDGYSGIFLWGAQLEAGAFPTSYIPTVASQVTRSADSASMIGTNFSSWFRQGEGTLYAEASTFSTAGAPYYFAISDGTNANTIIAYKAGSTVYNDINANNVLQFRETLGGNTSTTPIKLGSTYNFNNSAFSRDGSVSTTDTFCVIPIVNRLNIGVRGDANQTTSLDGHIKRLTYFPQRLDNAELVEMTEQ
jgi:hypothetical protein